MDRTTVKDPADLRRSKRQERHSARRVLWQESSLPRVKRCAKNVSAKGQGVAIKATGTGAARRAGFSGIAVCGSTWACPCCSAKISAGRAEDLAAAFAGWRARGGHVAMLTLTMRHRSDQALKRLWDAQAYAWGKVTSGRMWQAEQNTYGIAGWVRVVEVTHGANGWHVHVHAALFLTAPVSAPVLEFLGDGIHARWSRALERKGMAAPWRDFTNLKVLAGEGDLSDYFTKNTYSPSSDAWEVVGGQGKDGRNGNRTPFRILADVVQLGDADDLDLWHEWEQASHGRRQLTWSKGMRERLALGSEVDDQDLAESDDLDGQVLVVVRDWRMVRNSQAFLLDLAESDDHGDRLRDWLRLHGIPFDLPS